MELPLSGRTAQLLGDAQRWQVPRNRWGVDVGAKGDAYVYCRDSPRRREGQPPRLRARATSPSAVTSRRASAWTTDSGTCGTEPDFDTNAIATFSLLFPPWGVGTGPGGCSEARQEGRAADCGAPGEGRGGCLLHRPDAGRNMRGHVRHIVLGQLPVTDEKTLHVIAWNEPEGDLMDLVRGAFPHASATFSERGLGDDEYTLHVQGYRRPGTPRSWSGCRSGTPRPSPNGSSRTRP